MLFWFLICRQKLASWGNITNLGRVSSNFAAIDCVSALKLSAKSDAQPACRFNFNSQSCFAIARPARFNWRSNCNQNDFRRCQNAKALFIVSKRENREDSGGGGLALGVGYSDNNLILLENAAGSCFTIWRAHIGRYWRAGSGSRQVNKQKRGKSCKAAEKSFAVGKILQREEILHAEWKGKWGISIRSRTSARPWSERLKKILIETCS